METGKYLCRRVECLYPDYISTYGLSIVAVKGRRVEITPFEKEMPNVRMVDGEIRIFFDAEGLVESICGIEDY